MKFYRCRDTTVKVTNKTEVTTDTTGHVSNPPTELYFTGHVTSTFMILVCSGKLCLSTNAPDPLQFDKIFQHKIVNLEPEFCYVTHLSVANNMVSILYCAHLEICNIKSDSISYGPNT